MKFITLHDLNGKVLLLNAMHIVAIYEYLSDDINAKIITSLPNGHSLLVKETMDDIEEMLSDDEE